MSSTEICQQCGDRFREEFGVTKIRGHVVARERFDAPRGRKATRVFFACDFGHTWNHLYSENEKTPEPAIVTEDERGVMNSRPAPEPLRCPVVNCSRHVTSGTRCFEHFDCDLVNPVAEHCASCALRALEQLRAGEGDRCPHGELVTECDACFGTWRPGDAARERS